MTTIDVEAVECTHVSRTGFQLVRVKDEMDMLKISKMLNKPILRIGVDYFIMDAGVCYCYRKD